MLPTKRFQDKKERNLPQEEPHPLSSIPLSGKGDSRKLPTGTPNVPKTKVKESFFEERSRFFGYYFEKRQTIIFTFFYRHATNPKNIQSMPLRTPGIKSFPAPFFGKGDSHGPSRAAYPVPTLGNFTHTDSKSAYHPFAEVFPKKNPQFHANSLKPKFFNSSFSFYRSEGSSYNRGIIHLFILNTTRLPLKFQQDSLFFKEFFGKFLRFFFFSEVFPGDFRENEVFSSIPPSQTGICR